MRQLGEEARSYAEAEIAFQTSRALYVLRAVRRVALFGLVGVIVAVFALVALVVGTIVALAPQVGAWGATAIVAGSLATVALVSVSLAKARWRRTMRTLRGDGDRR